MQKPRRTFNHRPDRLGTYSSEGCFCFRNSESHNQFLSPCQTNVRPGRTVVENMHLKCFWLLPGKQSPALRGDVKKTSTSHFYLAPEKQVFYIPELIWVPHECKLWICTRLWLCSCLSAPKKPQWGKGKKPGET